MTLAASLATASLALGLGSGASALAPDPDATMAPPDPDARSVAPDPDATIAAPDHVTPGRSALDQAREASGLKGRPKAAFRLPAGRLRISPVELLASASGQPIVFEVRLARPVKDATLAMTLPADWLRTEQSGLRTALPPSQRRTAGGDAKLRRHGRSVALSFTGAEKGDRASFDVTDIGIPAGTYQLPYRWRKAGSRRSAGGVAKVVIYAPVREGLPDDGVDENISSDSIEESEAFIAAMPTNSDRVAAAINWQSSSMPAFISADGGHTWTERTMPSTIDAPNTTKNEIGDICCDPSLAADPLGNIWVAALSLKKGTAPSRIVVNRISAGSNTFHSLTVGLPVRVAGEQDKPMMTIDNSAGSPTFGRLYVVWDEPASGGVKLVISKCDTRGAGFPDPGHCDNADNWSAPASITPIGGSYIYGDVAVGPQGQVYVTWWNYSSANAIQGASCNPNLANCAQTGWSAPRPIALLDSTGGKPVPFACPILAQPGGRASPSPQVEVDHSPGPFNGRVYVTWGDLRPGSGTTRCATNTQNPDGTPPRSTHLTWDPFVASASGVLPGGGLPSASVGTGLYSDGESGAASPNSDDWFAWLSVDQTTGQAWADFYSTRDDSSRHTTNFYARSVTPWGGGHVLGTLTRVSANPSDYSSNPCCNFGNDYGDYTGIDAAGGVTYPVWTDNSTGDGEAFTFVRRLTPPSAPTVVTGGATSIGQTSATLNGTVNPNGQSTTYHFEYGLNDCGSGGCTSTPDANAGAGSGAQPVSAAITSGLTADTVYHFRLVAENATGTSFGSDQTFTTDPAHPGQPPDVSTGIATSIGQSTATVNGRLNPNGDSTTYHFEYGLVNCATTTPTTCASTAESNAGNGTSDVFVLAGLIGLTPSTTYHFRLVATNPNGTAYGADRTFETATPPPPAPTVTTGGPSLVGAFGATVLGTVNPNGVATAYHFEYGGSRAYGSATADTPIGADHADHQVSASLSPLLPSTTYHYRLVATSAGGTAIGDDASLVTDPDLIGPRVGILNTRAKMSRAGVTRLRLHCPASEPGASCVGRVRLTTAGRVSFRGKWRRLGLGTARFDVPRGETARVAITLAPAKRRLIEALGRVRVRAAARATDASGNVGVSRRRLSLVALAG